MKTFTYQTPSPKHVSNNILKNAAVTVAPEIFVQVEEKHREIFQKPNRAPPTVFDDLYLNLRPFLIFGTVIGLVPIQGLWQQKFENLSFSKSSIPSYICLIISLLLAVNSLVGIASLANRTGIQALDYAWAVAIIFFYSAGFYFYMHFYRCSSRLVTIMNKWNRLQLHFTQPDLRLYRDMNLIAGLIMTSAVLENAFGHLLLFPIVSPLERKGSIKALEAINGSAWEVYYSRSHPEWAVVVPYHVSAAIFVFCSNKFAVYAWDYADIIIMLLSRAIYFKFKALYIQGEALLFTGHANPTKWREFAKDHEQLCDVLQEIGIFLSPLIFVCYGANIYFICLQIYFGLASSGTKTLTSTVYAVWSFVHLATRVLLISLFGSEVHEWAHRVTELFRKCPTEMYTSEVERAERYVSTNTIGLSGFGCFTITKPLLLQIIGVIFTFEIVLLQASPHTCPCREENNGNAGTTNNQ